MRVLVACEYSGTVRDAFSRRGHDAWSCDLLPTESELTMKEDKHIQGDVLEVIKDGWDLMIGHPPCNSISYAGTSSWNNTGRVFERLEALRFFAEYFTDIGTRDPKERARFWPGIANAMAEQWG